jgi:hypothetical protein
VDAVVNEILVSEDVIDRLLADQRAMDRRMEEFTLGGKRYPDDAET